MDPITRSIRQMYEEFPYPSGVPNLRVGTDVRLLLSYGRLARPEGTALHVLDAGCGRGVGTIGAAALQPDVQFLGIDVNRVGLADAASQARARGLTNVSFAEVDLMTLEGLTIPPGGFDVINSSGVLHHLASPGDGLRRLRECLAPHGMLSLMVYGRHGREPLYRMVVAIDLLIGRDRPLKERLAVGRTLASALGPEAPTAAGPFSNAAGLDDVEFVDRYLNVNETSYSVAELFRLLDDGGFRFVRWTEPEEWDLAKVLALGPARERASHLDAHARYELCEQLGFRHRLELVACRSDNQPREPLAPADLLRASLRVSPDVSFSVETRSLRNALRVESMVLHRRRERLPVAKGPLATGLLVAKDQAEPFRGQDMVNALVERGLAPEAALAVVVEIVHLEVLYVPHANDV